MNCPACSNSLSSNAKFCPKCGWANRPVESSLSDAGEQVQPSVEENAAATKVCTECGAASKLTAKFCPKCSHAFKSGTVVNEVADAPQPHGSQDISVPTSPVGARVEELRPEPESVDMGLPLKAVKESLSVAVVREGPQSESSVHGAETVMAQQVTAEEARSELELDASAQPREEVANQQDITKSAQEKPSGAPSDVAIHSQESAEAATADASNGEPTKPLWKKLLLGFVVLLMVLAVGTWYVMKDSGRVVLKEEVGTPVITDKSPQAGQDAPNNDAAHDSAEKQGADNQSPNNADAPGAQENTVKEPVVTENPPAQVVKPVNQSDAKPAAKPSTKGAENKEKPSAARSAIY